MTQPILKITNVSVHFTNPMGPSLIAVDRVTLQLNPGETLAVVGESGCGKSTLAMAIMGLLPKSNSKTEGEIIFENSNLLSLSESSMQKIRGKKIAMIFQDPMTSLNPYLTVGEQIIEQILQHTTTTKKEAYEKALGLLTDVGIKSPSERINRYPHEFSGGMRQRVMIACALSCEPQLLIADEPTTALDVTIQAQIMRLIKNLIQQKKMGLLLITHDLGVVAESCQNVAVMYAGQVIEAGTVIDIFKKSKHPYTYALLQSVPKLTNSRDFKLLSIAGQPPAIYQRPESCRFYDRCEFRTPKCLENEPELKKVSDSHWHRCPVNQERFDEKGRAILNKNNIENENVLEINDLKIHFISSSSLFSKTQKVVKAVDGVSLFLRKGEILGLVGESGCGKSTLIRGVLQLIKPNRGQVIYRGDDLTKANAATIQKNRQKIQIIFQDPFGSLNARLKVFDIIAEPLINFFRLNKQELKEKVFQLLDEVGLNRDWAYRYPHQFSGGQRQRIGIARALSVNPEILLCDEPISALDVSIQAQIINLLQELQQKHKLSIIFISHDLSVVRHISDRIAVMYQGKIVEIAEAEKIYTNATHPYTQSLLSAIPIPDPTLQKNEKILNLLDVHKKVPASIMGCKYYERCEKGDSQCLENEPQLTPLTSDHQIACFHSNKESINK
jgi:peptide/nickel transport system ATP-binding protein